MTKKKRELIEILLDNVKPEDWLERLPYAAQDTSTFRVFFYSQEPKISGGRYFNGSGESYYSFEADEICEHWNKSIVHREEFMKRWNERNQIDEKESHADHEVKLLAFDDVPMPSVPVSESSLETQIGGDHYTKLAIQPMQYSMKNGLDPLQHTIIKYVTRFRDKAGIEDLEKAKHCIDMLIEFERDK